SDYKENIWQIISQRNQFGIAFSTAKIAINIALETGSDNKLIKLLKILYQLNKVIMVMILD
ncbi:12549_t:CDS:1, partial [Funneliformis caledonium]